MQSSIMVENRISGGRTKHVTVRYHFITRELITCKVTVSKYTEWRDHRMLINSTL